MSLASDLTATASNLLRDFAQSISVSRDVVATFIPSSGSVIEGTDIVYTGYGYPSSYNLSQIDGTIVRQDDTLLIFSSTTEPLVNDIFTVGTKVMTAISIVKVTVQGLDVLYKVQLRQ